LPFLYKLALAKLFVDQALPSAGVSGTIVAAQALERSALPRGAVLAGVVINTTSFFTAYIVALCVALGILFRLGRANPVILVPSLLFLLVSGVLAAGTLLLSGRDLTRPGHRFLRFRLVRNALNAMKDADPALVRNVKVQALAAICQLITFLLDAVTLWTLVRSLGADLSLSYAFASFMVANLVRTLSFIPGGLGTFEAAAVLMLRLGGLSVAASLSTVLLFRGVTFFLPMAPGLWFSRRLVPHVGAN
jgi:uncharacterized protein (TIRG00374 family)